MKKETRSLLLYGAIALVLVALLLLIFLMPHQQEGPVYEYNYTTAVYEEYDSAHEKVVSSKKAGTKEYPYLLKDQNSVKLAFDKIQEGLQEEVTADKQTPAYIKLAENTSIEKTSTTHFEVAENMNVVLDLNGKILLDEGRMTISNKGQLVIEDNSVAQNGKVDSKEAKTSSVVNQQGGVLTIKSGEICRLQRSDKQWDDCYYAHYVFVNYGTATIEGGKFYSIYGATWLGPGDSDYRTRSSIIENGWTDEAGHGCQKYGEVDETTTVVRTGESIAKLTITGGEVTSGKHCINNEFYSELTVTGGTFTSGYDVVREGKEVDIIKSESNAKMTITGGTFVAGAGCDYILDIRGEANISGGSFKADNCKYLAKVTGTLEVSSKAGVKGKVSGTQLFEGESASKITGEFGGQKSVSVAEA